ncbi:unnamed protein product, partial [Didymodactylos carnosus]
MDQTDDTTTAGFTYTYGVRRASRPDVFRTQFGSLSAEEYITPLVQRNYDGNVARRLSRNSFLIPRQTLVRRETD